MVVAGSGGAALTAAYTAASAGLRTLVLEKTDYFGGTSAYSGAGIWLPGNQAQHRAGVADSVALGREYFRAVVGGGSPRALQDAYLDTGPELVEFLERDPALRFAYAPFPDYFEAPGRIPGGRDIFPVPLKAGELGDLLARLRKPIGEDQFGVPPKRGAGTGTLIGGQALIGRFLLALSALPGADLRTGTRMRSLIVSGGRVTGVVAARDGTQERILAGRAVIVAAGGFECDDALRARHHKLPHGNWTSAAPGSNTGDALAALTGAGAAVDLMDEAWWCPATLFPNGRAAFTLGLRGGIVVNAAGKRFANESLPYDRMGREIRRGQETGVSHLPAWLVFDGRFSALPAITQPAPTRTSSGRPGCGGRAMTWRGWPRGSACPPGPCGPPSPGSTSSPRQARTRTSTGARIPTTASSSADRKRQAPTPPWSRSTAPRSTRCRSSWATSAPRAGPAPTRTARCWTSGATPSRACTPRATQPPPSPVMPTRARAPRSAPA